MATTAVVPGPQERLRDFRARGEDLERHCLKLRAKGELHPAVTPYDAPATEDVENVTALGGPEALDELLRVRMRSMALMRLCVEDPDAPRAHREEARARADLASAYAHKLLWPQAAEHARDALVLLDSNVDAIAGADDVQDLPQLWKLFERVHRLASSSTDTSDEESANAPSAYETGDGSVDAVAHYTVPALTFIAAATGVQELPELTASGGGGSSSEGNNTADAAGAASGETDSPGVGGAAPHPSYFLFTSRSLSALSRRGPCERVVRKAVAIDGMRKSDGARSKLPSSARLTWCGLIQALRWFQLCDGDEAELGPVEHSSSGIAQLPFAAHVARLERRLRRDVGGSEAGSDAIRAATQLFSKAVVGKSIAKRRAAHGAVAAAQEQRVKESMADTARLASALRDSAFNDDLCALFGVVGAEARDDAQPQLQDAASRLASALPTMSQTSSTCSVLCYEHWISEIILARLHHFGGTAPPVYSVVPKLLRFVACGEPQRRAPTQSQSSAQDAYRPADGAATPRILPRAASLLRRALAEVALHTQVDDVEAGKSGDAEVALEKVELAVAFAEVAMSEGTAALADARRGARAAAERWLCSSSAADAEMRAGVKLMEEEAQAGPLAAASSRERKRVLIAAVRAKLLKRRAAQLMVLPPREIFDAGASYGDSASVMGALALAGPLLYEAVTAVRNALAALDDLDTPQHAQQAAAVASAHGTLARLLHTRAERQRVRCEQLEKRKLPARGGDAMTREGAVWEADIKLAAAARARLEVAASQSRHSEVEALEAVPELLGTPTLMAAKAQYGRQLSRAAISQPSAAADDEVLRQAESQLSEAATFYEQQAVKGGAVQLGRALVQAQARGQSHNAPATDAGVAMAGDVTRVGEEAQTLWRLTAAIRLQLVSDASRRNKAVEALEHALAAIHAVHGEHSLEAARTNEELAQLHMARDDAKGAKQAMTNVLEIQTMHFGRRSARITQTRQMASFCAKGSQAWVGARVFDPTQGTGQVSSFNRGAGRWNIKFENDSRETEQQLEWATMTKLHLLALKRERDAR